MNLRAWCGLFLLGALAVVGTGCTQAEAPRAEEPAWGKEACGHCSMLVTEQHPAGQAVLSDGTRRYYDDVGCMALEFDREKAPARAAWVNDGHGGWTPLESARFAPGQRTPMDFGFLASPAGSATFVQVQQAARAKAKGGQP